MKKCASRQNPGYAYASFPTLAGLALLPVAVLGHFWNAGSV